MADRWRGNVDNTLRATATAASALEEAADIPDVHIADVVCTGGSLEGIHHSWVRGLPSFRQQRDKADQTENALSGSKGDGVGRR